MEIIRLENISTSLKGAMATIGFFDGVHRGHRYLLDKMKSDAREHGLQTMVITFARHPRQVLQQEYIPELLSPNSRKKELLEQIGIDQLVILDFTPEMAQLTAQEFMLKVLKEKLSVERLLIGYDNRFGRNREAGFNDYVAYGQQVGITVINNDAFTMPGTKISSSAVRLLIKEGNIEMANDCLGYEYAMKGVIVHGDGRGRTLGFPTANMEVNPEQLLPARGVYAVRVWIEGYDEEFTGMMNIGQRPTFNLRGVTLEVNVLDFDADIYDRKMRVAFTKRIREERKFNGAQQLIEQLNKDKEEVRRWKEEK